MTTPITIADYDPTWPAQYEAERAAIQAAIEPHITASEHMGSTSVPGLGAKPIIDIMVGLRDLTDAVPCIAPLATLGYEYVPEYEAEMPERRYFRKGPLATRSHQVHMVVEGDPFWERHLLFRDYLRAHPAQARAYETLKRDLAARYGADREGYTEAKSDFILGTEAAARAERSEREAGIRVAHDAVIQQTAAYVQQLLTGEGSGHDWWHIYRVWHTALQIGQQEGADLFVVQLAALLHDIADWKFHAGDETVGPQQAQAWLEGLQVEEAVIAAVCAIIHDLSFKGAGVTAPPLSREGQVVQDADRLDALGAIGIARCFAYGGYARREIYNPDQPPEWHESFAQYKQSTGSSINHFYEKLLLLKDRMNTPAARQMAEERHQFMEQFLARFFHEWEGDA